MECMQLSGPTKEGEPVTGSLQWIIANNGTATWKEGTALKLLDGPRLADPSICCPPAAPGQTVIIDLELRDTDQPATLSYGLIGLDGIQFGPKLIARVAPKIVKPIAAPGELESIGQWLRAIGRRDGNAWPEDAEPTLLAVSPLSREYSVSSRNSPYFSQTITVSVETNMGDDDARKQMSECRHAYHSVDSIDGADTVEATNVVEADEGVPAVPLDAQLFQQALERVSDCDWEKQQACYCTLLKICRNIRSSPGNAKFRQIPKSSKKFAADVLHVLGGSDILKACGFVEDDVGFSLPEDAGSLREIEAKLQDFANDAMMKQKRRERDEKIAREKSRGKNFFVNKPKAEMQETVERIKNDQEDLAAKLADMPTKASKAKLTSWGAKVSDSSGSVSLGAKSGGALGGGQNGN